MQTHLQKAAFEEAMSKLEQEKHIQNLKNDELKAKNEKLSKKINDLSCENSKLRDNLAEYKTSLQTQEVINQFSFPSFPTEL